MITQVSKITGIPPLIILEATDNATCEIRQLYWKLMRMHGYKFREIAILSGKNHSTIVSGIKHIDGLINSDKQTAQLWEKINKISRNCDL